MGSDITPQQVREAIAVVERDVLFVGKQLAERGIPSDESTFVVIDAARAWVDLYEQCGECAGTRLIWDCKCGHPVENHNLDIDEAGLDFCSGCGCRKWRQSNCPDCAGRGYVLNRERLEAAAKAIDVVIGIPDDGDDYELPLVRWNEAEAGVLAFLEGKQ